MTKTYLEPDDRQKARAYSPAVVTDGGRVVWMAGQTATVDAEGKDIRCGAPAARSRISSP